MRPSQAEEGGHPRARNGEAGRYPMRFLVLLRLLARPFRRPAPRPGRVVAMQYYVGTWGGTQAG
jgi:hypothetical protein